MQNDGITLATTPWAALAAWEADPAATILMTRTAHGPRYAVGRAPAVWMGHVGWAQTSPEEVETARER